MSEELPIEFDFFATLFPDLGDLEQPKFDAYLSLAKIQVDTDELNAETLRYARALMTAHLATLGKQGSGGRIAEEGLGAGSISYVTSNLAQTTYGEELIRLYRTRLFGLMIV